MSSLIVFDTCILIDELRSRKRQAQMLSLRGNIQLCSVVLAELFRGAATPVDVRALQALQKGPNILTPTEKNWLESGQILGKMHNDYGFTSTKLRDLHFDVLIALTVRSHGARLITSNRTDFELIQSYRHFDLEVW